MSAVLQNAREHKDHERRLYPNGYESVVLAPECFLRLNEAILQACMLRACHPAELDFSSSPELSKVMKELLVKVFARWDKNFGDSALEFAAAIAVGSLRLAKRDMETLLDDALKQHAGMQSELLGMLVLVKQANQWSGHEGNSVGLVNGPLSLLNHRCPSKIEASVGSWPKRNPGSPTPWHLRVRPNLTR